MDSMWWAAENWTEYIQIYIHPKLLQPWPNPVFTAHTCFSCHWQMHEDTSNFTHKHKSKLLSICIHTFLPVPGFSATSAATNGCNSEHFHDFLQTQRCLWEQRSWAEPEELKPSHCVPVMSELLVFWLPSLREQQGKPVPVSHYHLREEFLANIQSKPALFQFGAIPLCPVTPSPLNLSTFLVLSSFNSTISTGSNLSRGYHTNKPQRGSPEMAAAGWGNGHSIFLITFIIIILLSALHTSSLVRARGNPELLWHSWTEEIRYFWENLIPNVPPESFWKCFFLSIRQKMKSCINFICSDSVTVMYCSYFKRWTEENIEFKIFL